MTCLSPAATATSGGSLEPACILLIPSNAGGEINFSEGGTLTPMLRAEVAGLAIPLLLEAIPRAVAVGEEIEDSIVFLSSREAINSGGGVGELTSFLAHSKASGSGTASSGS